MGWRWNPGAGRYYDEETGRFISRKHMLDLVDQSLRASVQVTDTLASWVSDGVINVDDWEMLMRQEIKGEYIRQYLSGIGGRQMMDARHWGRIGGLLRGQYRYLTNFKNDIATGELSYGEIRARAAMYVNAARRAHEMARAFVASGLGFDEVAWLVNHALENCEDCLEREEQGYQSVMPDGGFPTTDGSAFPGDGTTVCLTNCGCSLGYRNSETGEEFEG